MIEFLLPAIMAGLCLALMCAPLGSFIIWQRMAYFGDTLAHASLLGVALGLVFSINLQLSILFICLLLAVGLTLWQNQQHLSNDTLLGILSHSSLAVGLVLVSLADTGRVDIASYLLGDLLSTSMTDVIVVASLSLLIIGLVVIYWRPLIAIVISPELAIVEGISINKMRLLLMGLLALTIGIAITLVGILLITALLIIPAASARYFSRTPEQMVMWAGVFGCLSVVGGLCSSILWDTPASPSIVVTATVLLIISSLYKFKAHRGG